MRRPRMAALCLCMLGLVTVVGGVCAAAAQSAPGRNAIDARREQVRALEAELSAIDVQADEAADAQARSEQRTRALQREIASNRNTARRVRVRQTAARARLTERLVSLYTHPEPGPVAVLLSTGNLRDAVLVRDLQVRAGRRDAATVASLREARQELERIRRSLVAQRAASVRAAQQARIRRQEVERLLARRRAVLDSARDALDGLIARRERAAALARARAAAEAAVRARARATAPPAAPRDPPTAPPSATRPPAQDPTPAPTPTPSGGGPLAGGPSYETLNRIAACESGGNPRAISSGGLYRGKYQFDMSTWAAIGGSGDPAGASEAEQDLRAAMLYVQRGPAPWPICGYR